MEAQWIILTSETIQIKIILATDFYGKKMMALLFFLKNAYLFQKKTEHKNLTDPSQDVTDDSSIQGKSQQQLRIP